MGASFSAKLCCTGCVGRLYLAALSATRTTLVPGGKTEAGGVRLLSCSEHCVCWLVCWLELSSWASQAAGRGSTRPVRAVEQGDAAAPLPCLCRLPACSLDWKCSHLLSQGKAASGIYEKWSKKTRLRVATGGQEEQGAKLAAQMADR